MPHKWRDLEAPFIRSQRFLTPAYNSFGGSSGILGQVSFCKGVVAMSEFHLTMSQSQHDLLVRILNSALQAKRVEVHRTEFSRDFRHELEVEEAEIRSLLDKLAVGAAV
jgi:hypothetical protein